MCVSVLFDDIVLFFCLFICGLALTIFFLFFSFRRDLENDTRFSYFILVWTFLDPELIIILLYTTAIAVGPRRSFVELSILEWTREKKRKRVKENGCRNGQQKWMRSGLKGGGGRMVFRKSKSTKIERSNALKTCGEIGIESKIFVFVSFIFESKKVERERSRERNTNKKNNGNEKIHFLFAECVRAYVFVCEWMSLFLMLLDAGDPLFVAVIYILQKGISRWWMKWIRNLKGIFWLKERCCTVKQMYGQIDNIQRERERKREGVRERNTNAESTQLNIKPKEENAKAAHKCHHEFSHFIVHTQSKLKWYTGWKQ